MVMSMAFHINEPKNRVQHVKDFYDGVSQLDLSMPTPIQLNPFTKEIYAFPDSKSGGIVPMVSIDGWCRIINEHPQLDGIGFEMHNNGESCLHNLPQGS